MSNDNGSSVPNTISNPVLVAFILCTAIFSSLLTLFVTWYILQRRRRLKRQNAPLYAKRRTKLLQDPETPPMRTKSMFPPNLVVSPLHNQRNSALDISPSSSDSLELIGVRGSYELVEACAGTIPAAFSTPIEMMGSTTWGKGGRSSKPLGRQPSQLQVIAAAVTQEGNAVTQE